MQLVRTAETGEEFVYEPKAHLGFLSSQDPVNSSLRYSSLLCDYALGCLAVDPPSFDLSFKECSDWLHCDSFSCVGLLWPARPQRSVTLLAAVGGLPFPIVFSGASFLLRASVCPPSFPALVFVVTPALACFPGFLGLCSEAFFAGGFWIDVNKAGLSFCPTLVEFGNGLYLPALGAALMRGVWASILEVPQCSGFLSFADGPARLPGAFLLGPSHGGTLHDVRRLR